MNPGRTFNQFPEVTTLPDSDVLLASGPDFLHKITFKNLKAQLTFSTGALLINNNLSDVQSKSVSRINLGLGSASTKDVGTGPGQVLTVDSDGKYPAIDGSKITNIQVDGVTGVTAQTAGAGLSLDNSLALNVNVDGSSLEISSDTLRVKIGGISGDHIANGSIPASKLDAQSKANIFTITKGVVGATDTQIYPPEEPESTFYSDLFPPAGKSMLNFLGGITSPVSFGNLDSNLQDDLFVAEYEVLPDRIRIWHLHNCQRYIMGHASIQIKTAYFFMWT